MTGAPVGNPIRSGRSRRRRALQPRRVEARNTGRAPIPCLWDAVTGRPIGGRRRPGRAQVLAIAFHPDGTRLAAAGEDGQVRFWETATGTLLDPTLRHEAAVSALVFSPDGRTLLTGCLDGRARLWDAAAMDSLWRSSRIGPRSAASTVSPSGRSVATACP